MNSLGQFLSHEQTHPWGKHQGELLGGGDVRAAWKYEKVHCRLEGERGFQVKKFSVLKKISRGEGAAICKFKQLSEFLKP